MMQRHDTIKTGTPAPGVIVALYVILVLPFVLWPLDPQPDERFYSIAAAHMLETGDFLIPVSERGDERLKKPPLTYYYVAAGFALLGETLAGAKLFFLLSGAGIVFLTYALARALGATVPAATFGAAMIAGHRLFFTTSTQYIPDTPLILGTTAALFGFVHVLRGTARPWHLYLAWTGLAWAILAKGLLAPLMLAIYAIARHRPGAPDLGRDMKRHELRAAAIAFTIAVPWFVAVAIGHWDAFAAQFLGDQVTQKALFDATAVLSGIGNLAGQLVVLALPGMMILGVARLAAGGRVPASGLREPAAFFLWGWIGLNVTIFAFSSQVYGRYALPAAPALMALAAVYASRLPDEAWRRGCRASVRWLLPVAGGIVLVGSFAGLWFGAVGWGLAGLAVVTAGAPFLWRAASTRPIAAGTVFVALFFPMIELARLPLAHALLLPTDGQVAARIVADRAGATDRIVVLARNARLVDRIGVELKDIDRIEFASEPAEALDARLVIFSDPAFRDPLERSGYTVDSRPVPAGRDLSGDDIAAMISLRDPERIRETFGAPLFFATRE